MESRGASSGRFDPNEGKRRSLEGEMMEEGGTCSAHGNGAMESKVVQSFQKSFIQVQAILDQNKLLIDEINQNHESRAPDNLGRNVGLIRELNNNIRRVVHLYASLSAAFSKSIESSSDGDSASTPKASQKRARPG